MKVNKLVKEQIVTMCNMSNIPIDENFINFVYMQHLQFYSVEIMKQLFEEYNGRCKHESY